MFGLKDGYFMKGIPKFLMEHGLTIMLVGFSIFFICFLAMLFAGKNSDFMMKQVAIGGAIAGFCIYLVGRISVFLYNRNKRMHPEKFQDL
jgi:hypothetical protein